MSRVLTGIEVLRSRQFLPLKGKRVGLMTNPSAVDGDFNSTYDIFRHSDAVNLVALFGPEHGFMGSAPLDEMVPTAVDSRTGLPAYSLYGDSFRPTAEMLKGIDMLVCDIQDIGTRYYTYLWTISHIIEATGEFGVEVLILDRPNPLGGRVVAGPPLRSECSSFVGRYNIPVRHGMTLGEIVPMINRTWNPKPAALQVVACEGLRRDMLWEQTGLPFVPTSPGMAHLITARHYPGACLIEGTTLSEGRGTPLPFEVVGAPYMDGLALAEHLNAQGWAGVRFRAHSFVPSARKHAGEYCHGVQAHITDIHTYKPITTWLGVIREIHHLYPREFAWTPPYETRMHFDLLIGNSSTRSAIDNDAPLSALTAGWQEYCAQFEKDRQPYLLYE